MTDQIRFIHRSGPPAAMMCPFTVCAACNRPVYTVASPDNRLPGYVLWWDITPGGTARARGRGEFEQQVFIVHQETCAGAVEEYARSRGWGRCMSKSLSDFMDQVAYNASHPLGTDPAGDPEYPAEAEYVSPGIGDRAWRSGNYNSGD
jgi:hypothetical protein